MSDDAQALIITDTVEQLTTYSLSTISLRVIESVLSDAYAILAVNPTLLEILSKLRADARILNTRLAGFRSQVQLPMTNIESIAQTHNQVLIAPAARIAELAELAIRELETLKSVTK